MSARQLLLEKIMLLLITLLSICCTTNSTKSCSSYKGTDYIDKDDVENDIMFGDCSFQETFCNYIQGCKDDDANDWTESQGGAVCPGSDAGQYNSFSVLLSPLLSITQNTSLAFYYSQSLPGKLSAFLATTSGITEVYSGKDETGFFQHVLYIKSSVAKVGFKARKAESGLNVTLSYVKLTADPRFTTTPARVTTIGISSTSGQSVSSSTTQAAHVTNIGTSNTSGQSVPSSTTQAEGEKQEVRGNVGIIAGVLVAVVVVAVAGVAAGFFIWRRSKQQQHRDNEHDGTEGSQDIYQIEGSTEVQSTAAENSDSVRQHRNHYDVMTFDASTDIHIYNSIH